MYSNHENKDNPNNSNKRQKIVDEGFNPDDEEEVRMKDLLGSDNLSFNTESILYAAYSPAPSRLDDDNMFEYNNFDPPKFNAVCNNFQLHLNNIKWDQIRKKKLTISFK